MNPAVLIIMRSIAGLLTSPLLADRPKLQKLSELLALTASFAEKADEHQERLEEIADMVKTMVAEEREPTDDEWSGLKERADAAFERLNS